jgi:hypothetical protein
MRVEPIPTRRKLMHTSSGRWAAKIAVTVAACTAFLGGTVTRADAGFPALPSGFKALFTYTEVRTVLNEVSAMLHCTNVDFIKPVEVRWDVIDGDGDLLASDTFDGPIPPGHTRTAAIGAGGNQSAALFESLADEQTALFDPDTFDPRDANGGALRVAVKGGNKVICDLQVLDMVNEKPSFVYLPRQYTGAFKR